MLFISRRIELIELIPVNCLLRINEDRITYNQFILIFFECVLKTQNTNDLIFYFNDISTNIE